MEGNNLRLYGKIVKNTMILREEYAEENEFAGTYRENLEKCFLVVCKKLGLEVPIWMKKNTREFASYNKTMFFREHFIDDVPFDYFEIMIEK